MTWFITGASTGFGREMVLALLARGQKVVATARNVDAVKDLEEKGAVVCQWDVTDSLEDLQKKAAEIDEKVGGISVVVNNAGFVLGGVIECTTPADDRKIFDTNVFGLLNTTRAFLPHLRGRKSGTFVNFSSIAGLKGNAAAGLYNATKFAVEGISEALEQEIAPFGLRVLAVEPGYFRTKLFDSPPAGTGALVMDYVPLLQQAAAGIAYLNGNQPGDPVKGVNAIIDVVLGEGFAAGKPFPSKLALGPDAVGLATQVAKENLERLEVWGELGSSTNFA